MSGSVATRGIAADAIDSRPRAKLSPYAQLMVLVLISLPITVYAIWESTTWLNVNFPGFLLMENAVVPTVSGFSWPPDKAAVFHAQVLAVDGEPVQTSAEVFRHLESLAPGMSVDYTLLADGRVTHQTLPVRRFELADLLQIYGILFVFGCTNLIIGLAVGFMQPNREQSRVFAFHTFVAAMYAITSVFLHHPAFHLLALACLLFECMVSATFVHLAVTFPVVRGTARSRRIGLSFAYGASLLVFLLVVVGFERHPADLTFLHVSYSLIAFGLLCVAVAMAYAFWEKRSARAQLQIRAVMPGLLIACAAQSLVFVNNASAGRDVPMQSGLIAALFFYASIAYAIGKHDLFDIDRVTRLTYVYGGVSFVVVASYWLVLQIGALLLPASAERNTTIGAVFVLILAVAFDPLRRMIQTFVDRAFYRSRLDYRATIRELSQVMTTLLDLHEVTAQVTQRVTGAMQLETTALGLLGHDDEPATLWSSAQTGPPRQEPAPELPALIAALERTPAEADPQTLASNGSAAEAAAITSLLERTHATGVVPLMFHNRVTGALLLGPKLSGLPLDSEALDLLRTLADQTAIAVENAQSYRALAELNRSLDAKVRQQTEDLRASNVELSRAYDDLKNAQAQLVQSEKMASLGQLVAGVAHELNNPASFVHGGLANLAEYLNRFVQVLQAYEQAPLADAERAETIAQLRRQVRLDYLLRETPELLRVCFEGSERITKIVEDLRVFARADTGERFPVQVSEGIDSTLRLLTSRLNEHGVEVDRRYGSVPNVKADAGQLNQVWMNLLSNAIDALAGRELPIVTISVRRGDDNGSWVEVEVRDNGAGMPASVQERIFEPFFSTKPIGKGTGLGLSIAYGAVKSHGGSILVDSEPGRGTAIVVRLPSESHAKAVAHAA